MINKNINFHPHFYNIKVKCKYPNIQEAKHLVEILYDYHLELGQYIDLEYEAKYLSEKYSIIGVNKWTANMAISDNIYIPTKLFNYLVNKHIYVNYTLRLTSENLLKLRNTNFSKLKIFVNLFDDEYIKEWRYLWENEIKNLLIKVDNNLDHLIIIKNTGLEISQCNKYNFNNSPSSVTYDLLLRKLVKEKVEIHF